MLRKRLSFLILFVFISTFLIFPSPNFADESTNTAGDIYLLEISGTITSGQASFVQRVLEREVDPANVQAVVILMLLGGN